MTADRKLASPEIDLIIHMMKCGASLTPIALLPGARKIVGPLCKLGLVYVWHRQSVLRGRLEGPFYTLTREAVFRAEALLNARAQRAAKSAALNNSKLQTGDSTPPPEF